MGYAESVEGLGRRLGTREVSDNFDDVGIDFSLVTVPVLLLLVAKVLVAVTPMLVWVGVFGFGLPDFWVGLEGIGKPLPGLTGGARTYVDLFDSGRPNDLGIGPVVYDLVNGFWFNELIFFIFLIIRWVAANSFGRVGRVFGQPPCLGVGVEDDPSPFAGPTDSISRVWVFGAWPSGLGLWRSSV